MVQYTLIITVDNSYAKHSKQHYWAIVPGIHVPPEWKDVSACILEEWVKKIPDEGERATIGGAVYLLEDDLLLPVGQKSHFIMTEDDALLHWKAERHAAERELGIARNNFNRSRLNRRNLLLDGLLDNE